MFDKLKQKAKEAKDEALKKASELSDKTKTTVKKGVADLNEKVNGDKD